MCRCDFFYYIINFYYFITANVKPCRSSFTIFLCLVLLPEESSTKQIHTDTEKAEKASFFPSWKRKHIASQGHTKSSRLFTSCGTGTRSPPFPVLPMTRLGSHRLYMQFYDFIILFTTF